MKIISLVFLFSMTINLFSYDYFATVETNIPDYEMSPYIKTFHLLNYYWLELGVNNTNVKIAKNSIINNEKIVSLNTDFKKHCGSNFFQKNIKNIDYNIDFYNFNKIVTKKYILTTIYYAIPTEPVLKIQYNIIFTSPQEIFSMEIIDIKKVKKIPSGELRKLINYLNSR